MELWRRRRLAAPARRGKEEDGQRRAWVMGSPAREGWWGTTSRAFPLWQRPERRSPTSQGTLGDFGRNVPSPFR